MNELVPKSNLVLSETASVADGGCPNLSNRFVAGFYFMEILGSLGDIGVFQVYRQNLVGYGGINFASSYALLDPPGWFTDDGTKLLVPNPDYFTTLLYRKLVGSTRFETVVADNYYVHAACAAVGGGYVMTFINPSSNTLDVNLTLSTTHSTVCSDDDGGGGSRERQRVYREVYFDIAWYEFNVK